MCDAACDMAYRIATNTPGASVRRRTGTFNDDWYKVAFFCTNPPFPDER
jgi:hypothetical protein